MIMDKNKLKFTISYSIIMFIMCFSLSIGYSALNKELSIAGDAHYSIPEEVRITNIVQQSSSGMSTMYSPSHTKDTISFGVVSTSATVSYIEYAITVKNFTTSEKDIYGLSALNGSSVFTYHLSDRGMKIAAGESRQYILRIECPSGHANAQYQDTLTLQIQAYDEHYLPNNTNSSYLLDITTIAANKVESISFANLFDINDQIDAGTLTPTNQYLVSSNYAGLVAFIFDTDSDSYYEVIIASNNGEVFAGSETRIAYNMSFLTSIDFTNYNTSHLTSMNRMFHNCQRLPSVDLSGLDTSSVTSFENAFYNCNKLTSINFGNIDTHNVTTMKNAFQNLASSASSTVTSMDFSQLNTSSVKNTSNMFRGSNVASIILYGWDLAKVTNASYMFAQTNATTISYTTLNFTKATNLSYLFSESSSLTSINPSITTPAATNMSHMFYKTTAFTSSLDLSSFNTSKVTDMSYMFSYTGASSLNLSSFNTSIVSNMSYMFNYASNLRTVYVGSSWSTAALTTYNDMFNLSGIYGGSNTNCTGYNTNGNEKNYAKIDGGTSSPGCFTSG